jgi:septum formation protein
MPASPAPLVLASASPRRIDLLRAAGFLPEVVPATVEEIAPPHLTPGETTLFNARAKAHAVARLRPSAMVLGADTLVSIDGRVLGKPCDEAEAFEMLSTLAGRTHDVLTGVCIVHPGGAGEVSFIEASHVTFRALTPSEIQRYIRTVHTLDKAGSYAAQEDPMGIIACIDGSRTNVIGLPMEAVLDALRLIEPNIQNLNL